MRVFGNISDNAEVLDRDEVMAVDEILCMSAYPIPEFIRKVFLDTVRGMKAMPVDDDVMQECMDSFRGYAREQVENAMHVVLADLISDLNQEHMYVHGLGVDVRSALFSSWDSWADTDAREAVSKVLRG
jgi:hypothetical protein